MNIYFGVSKAIGVFPWITQRVSKLWLIYSFISNIICATLFFSAVIDTVCRKNTSVGMLYFKVDIVLNSLICFIPVLHWLRIVFHPKAEFVMKTVSLTPISRAHVCQISLILIVRIVVTARLWIAYKPAEFTIVRTLLPFLIMDIMFRAQLIMSQFSFTISDLSVEIVSCAHKLRTSPLIAVKNHEAISSTVSTIFQFYSPQIFLLFVSTTSHYSMAFHELLISKSGFDVIVFGIDLLSLVFQIVAYCENYRKTDNDFYEKLFQTLFRRNDCRSNPKMLLYLKTKARISFTACGFLTLKYSLFTSTFRHGFPNQPTAVAFDPIQKLLAIGCKNGSVRILGKFGVDCHVWHESQFGEVGVIQIVFLVNEGALITATTDDCVHLWNFRQKRPDLVHSLQFQRERITYMHLPLQSKWLYVGTQKGNIHVVNIETFQLSGYIINWNKAIEVSRKTHPGPVVHLCDNPLDSSKLLIGFETGQLVYWDLRLKQAEMRWQSLEPLKSLTWCNDGKQFMTSHTDGSILTWNLRQPGKPMISLQPHAKIGKDGKPEACKSIQKVEWKAARSGEQFVIFCGGMTYEKAGRSPSITIMQGKSTTVLEMEHNVIDFITLCESPYASDIPEPYAIVVVLQSDLVVIDLLSPGFPCFESPHPMDLHECPVTCCTYLADCPSDLIPAFYSVGSKSSKRTGFSDREWPLAGGEWTIPACSYSEIVITGHADGSIKFWDASCGTLQVLYKVKTSKVFERPTPKSQDGTDEDPFAVQLLSLCPESRKMCIAGAAGYVILFKFKRQEATSETAVLDIPIAYETFDDSEVSPEADYSGRGNISKLSSADNQIFGADCGPSVKVKPGLLKKPPGFQAVLVCLSPSPISSLGLNSSYGLLAYGTDTGAVIVDMAHKVCLLNIATPDLYGGADPYQRVPKSPKRTQPPDSDPDRCRSPSIDQGVDVLEELNQSGSASPHEEPEIEPRKKKFNLKKQLSRVDIKLKFQPRNNKRSNSVFYPDESPTSLSPEEESVPVIKEPDLEEKPERPSELPLFEEKGVDRPTPPPRRDKKDKEVPKRDTRLLSVPNIKYHPKQNQASLARKMNKLDSSFSRSRSSSMSSLENISSEAVQCIAFADSYSKKTDSTTFPTLWLGTSLGSVLTVMLNVPSPDIRATQPVTIGPFGTMFRLKGSILTMSFLDCNGALIPYTFESWRDDGREKQRSSRTNSNSSRMSPPGSASSEISCDRQFVVIVSEKQAIVAALPSHNVVYKVQITEADFVVKGEIISLKDSVCLVCYISNGHICAYSLPSLRMLIDTDFLPLSDLSFQTRKPGIVDPMLSIWGQQMFVNEDTDQIARTFSFSNHGHGLFLCSPTEVQKFTVAAEFCASLGEMVGELFLPHEMPEPPKESFFKGLFGGGSRSLDREELFGEQSGKASRTVAKHIPGINQLQTDSSKACNEVQKAHRMVVERGDKLSQLEERTEKMMNEAENFQSSAHSLMLKYKDKKWYQI